MEEATVPALVRNSVRFLPPIAESGCRPDGHQARRRTRRCGPPGTAASRVPHCHEQGTAARGTAARGRRLLLVFTGRTWVRRSRPHTATSGLSGRALQNSEHIVHLLSTAGKGPQFAVGAFTQCRLAAEVAFSISSKTRCRKTQRARHQRRRRRSFQKSRPLRTSLGPARAGGPTPAAAAAAATMCGRHGRRQTLLGIATPMRQTPSMRATQRHCRNRRFRARRLPLKNREAPTSLGLSVILALPHRVPSVGMRIQAVWRSNCKSEER